MCPSLAGNRAADVDANSRGLRAPRRNVIVRVVAVVVVAVKFSCVHFQSRPVEQKRTKCTVLHVVRSAYSWRTARVIVTLEIATLSVTLSQGV